MTEINATEPRARLTAITESVTFRYRCSGVPIQTSAAGGVLAVATVIVVIDRDPDGDAHVMLVRVDGTGPDGRVRVVSYDWTEALPDRLYGMAEVCRDAVAGDDLPVIIGPEGEWG